MIWLRTLTSVSVWSRFSSSNIRLLLSSKLRRLKSISSSTVLYEVQNTFTLSRLCSLRSVLASMLLRRNLICSSHSFHEVIRCLSIFLPFSALLRPFPSLECLFCRPCKIGECPKTLHTHLRLHDT